MQRTISFAIAAALIILLAACGPVQQLAQLFTTPTATLTATPTPTLAPTATPLPPTATPTVTPTSTPTFAPLGQVVRGSAYDIMVVGVHKVDYYMTLVNSRGVTVSPAKGDTFLEVQVKFLKGNEFAVEDKELLELSVIDSKGKAYKVWNPEHRILGGAQNQAGQMIALHYKAYFSVPPAETDWKLKYRDTPTIALLSSRQQAREVEFDLQETTMSFGYSLKEKEAVVGVADVFEASSGCIAFLMVGPGSFDVPTQGRRALKWANTTPQLNETLLQEQIDWLVSQRQCARSAVQVKRLP